MAFDPPTPPVPSGDEAAAGDPRLVGLLRERIAEVDAVSFDVLDTLHHRLVAKPEDVFDLVGVRHNLFAFRRVREEAQAQAFQVMIREDRREIDLDGVYACLPPLPVAAEVLKAEEEALELAVLRLNPEMAQLFAFAQAQGKRVVLTSDMYLPLRVFEALCARDGLKPDHIFVSSACQATKRDHGALFDHVADALGVAPGRILHIGDNPHSDVLRARERGFQTFHYVPVQTAAFGPEAPLDARVVQGVSLSQAYQPGWSDWRRLGFAYGGPAALAFQRFVETCAAEDEGDLVLNVARDGYTLHRLWRDDASAPSAYFRTSRTALTLASVTDESFEDDLPFLLSGAEDLMLLDLFARIGVEPPAPELLADLGLHATTRCSPQTRPLFEAVLRVWRYRILRACSRTRRGLHAYLRQMGLRQGMRVGFVDLGWSGTTQDAFLRAVAPFVDLDVRGYYLCLRDDEVTRARRERLSMRALISADTHPPAQVHAIYANRVVSELFFSAPHASTIGYTLVPDGQVGFVDDLGRGADPRLAEVARELDAGAVEAARTLRDLEAELRTPLSSAALLAPLLHLALSPTAAQAETIGSLHNFDAWGSSAGFQSFMARAAPPGHAARGDAWPAGLAALARG